MNFEDINFPVYRKYKNNKNYFKIISNKHFEEIQLIGDKIIVKEIKAAQLPEYNHINDLLYHYKAFAEEITEAEYLEMANKK